MQNGLLLTLSPSLFFVVGQIGEGKLLLLQSLWIIVNEDHVGNWIRVITREVGFWVIWSEMFSAQPVLRPLPTPWAGAWDALEASGLLLASLLLCIGPELIHPECPHKIWKSWKRTLKVVLKFEYTAIGKVIISGGVVILWLLRSWVRFCCLVQVMGQAKEWQIKGKRFLELPSGHAKDQ